MQVLESLFNETVRPYVSIALVREMNEEIIISGRLLKKGRRFMIPFGLLHTDTETWGVNVIEFENDRFKKNRKLAKNSELSTLG